MSDETPTSMPPLLRGVLVFLGVSASTASAWLATPTGDLLLSAKLLAPVATAFGALLLLWASWTYSLWKRDSKWERSKDARAQGRLMCDCTKSGEIMTQHHALGHSMDVYACPVCTNIEVVHPKGTVLISDDVQFRPPLPATARQHWFKESRANR